MLLKTWSKIDGPSKHTRQTHHGVGREAKPLIAAPFVPVTTTLSTFNTDSGSLLFDYLLVSTKWRPRCPVSLRHTRCPLPGLEREASRAERREEPHRS